MIRAVVRKLREEVQTRVRIPEQRNKVGEGLVYAAGVITVIDELLQLEGDASFHDAAASKYTSPENLRLAKFHSALSATIGSTRVARRAGMRHANNATTKSTIETPVNVSGSVGEMP